MKKLFSLFFLVSTYLSATMLISAGGYDVSKYESQYTFRQTPAKQYNVNITEVLQKRSQNVNSVTIWITKDWQEEWFDAKTTQTQIIDKGYIPVFIFYWFGDEISVEFVKKHEKTYFQVLNKFLNHLKKLDGQKVVVLNPEYNMHGVEKWDGMNDIFLKSYEVLRQDPQVIVGPCVGDFGNYRKVDEPEEWKLFHPSIRRAVKSADFIAFQEMRSLTRNKKEDILKTAKRAKHLAKYLHKTYKKPTVLAYVALSSYGEGGESMQASVYKDFVYYLPQMKKEADLRMFGVFHYFDYPKHVGYFNEGEEHFGILRSNGSYKPSFWYFDQLH
jgi:hypothetical protein